jgi:ubiquinone biosynthesis protein
VQSAPSLPEPTNGPSTENLPNPGELVDRPAIVAPIPRRRQVEFHQQVDSLIDRRKEKFRPSFTAIAARLLVWSRCLAAFAFHCFVDYIFLRGSRERNAVRLREMMQNMGPTAIKLGQQLSVRADLLPAQYCNELRNLLDNVPPFGSDLAIRIIQEETGRKIEEIFAQFDPCPIGSASVACVFQAYLLDGTRVAVKVRRPRIGDRMSADLRALILIAKVVEALGVTRPGLSDLPMRELERMLLDELDFKLEARYTEIFRQDAKDVKYVSAPRVFFEYSTSKILVTEFVSGVFLSELLRVVDAGDEETLAKFRARGFDLKKVSRRMMRVFFWEIFQSHFFHADPHPANIIIRADNTLVMIDFGSCGEISRSYRRDLLNFYRHLEQADLNGVVRSMISSLEPLPPIDIEAYSNDLLAIVREAFIAIQSEYASWEEKCAGGMWMKLINLHREYDIPTRPDVLRFFRASFLYDSIIYRLNPEFDQIKEFRRWHKRWGREARQRVTRKIRQRLLGPTGRDYLQLENLLSIGLQGVESMQRFLNRPDYDYAHRVDKLAFVISIIIKSAVQGVLLVLLLSICRFMYLVARQKMSLLQEGALWSTMSWVLSQPMLHVSLFLLVLIVIRKMLMRLDDVDVR